MLSALDWVEWTPRNFTKFAWYSTTVMYIALYGFTVQTAFWACIFILNGWRWSTVGQMPSNLALLFGRIWVWFVVYYAWKHSPQAITEALLTLSFYAWLPRPTKKTRAWRARLATGSV